MCIRDRTYSLYDVIALTMISRKPGTFLVKEAKASKCLNFRERWSTHYKKYPVSEDTKLKPKI